MAGNPCFYQGANHEYASSKEREKIVRELEQLTRAHLPEEAISEHNIHFSKRRLLCSAIALYTGLLGMIISLAGPFAGQWWTLAYLPLSFGLLLPGGYALLIPLLRRSWQVRVYPSGLVVSKQREMLIFLWDHIDAVWQKTSSIPGLHGQQIRYSFTIRRHDGRKLVLDHHFSNIEQLGTTIQQEVTRRLFRKAIFDLAVGHTVPFGPLGINRYGLFHGSDSLAWNDASIQVNSAEVSITQPSSGREWYHAHTATVPNIYLLLSLITHIHTYYRKKAATSDSGA